MFHPFTYPFRSQETVIPNLLQAKAVQDGDTTKFTIIIILDKSGSMSDIRNDMIGSFNTFIAQQKTIAENPPQVSLILFNNQLDAVYINKKLEEIPELSPLNYQPTGGTALYDAVGSTLDSFDSYTNVLVVIITDGEENASKEYTYKQMKEKISKKNADKWQFVYLSDNLENSRQGERIGLCSSSQTTNHVVPKCNFGTYFSSNITTAVNEYRQYTTSISSQLQTPNPTSTPTRRSRSP